MLVQSRVVLHAKLLVVALALTMHASEHSSAQSRHETRLGLHTRQCVISDGQDNRHTINPNALAIHSDASGGHRFMQRLLRSVYKLKRTPCFRTALEASLHGDRNRVIAMQGNRTLGSRTSF